MRIFGGKFRSTMHAPNQPDTVNSEDWRSLQLDIQVCTPILPPVLVANIKAFQKHDSVHAVEDALARISHLRHVQLDPSGFSEVRQQFKIEVFPPFLVLHLKRFLYDVAADGIVKINKYVQFAPELKIPPGTIFHFPPC
jgi:ubiquitin carboxyl-terminal hydrolase 10